MTQPVRKRKYSSIKHVYKLNQEENKVTLGLSQLWNENVYDVRNEYRQATKAFEKFEYAPRPKTVERQNFSGMDTLQSIRQAEVDRVNKGPIKPKHFLVHEKQKLSPSHYVSFLQQRLLDIKTLSNKQKKYLRALSILEYENEHGRLTDQELNVSMIHDSVWTPSEKKRFFIALDRCGKNTEEISRRIGPTKTIAEVENYLNVLDTASKSISKKPIQHPFAREMSCVFITQEEMMSRQIEDILELESYQKHLNLCTQPQLEKSLQLFELWNLSSMTRLFSRMDDMTVLCSTVVNFHQLIKKFIQDIMIDLHTQMLNKKDKMVSTSLVNFVVAKRAKCADRRLADLDIMAAMDKEYRIRAPYAVGRSISYLAKRRRLNGSSEEEVLKYESLTDQEQEKEQEEKEEEAIFISDDEEDTEDEEEEDPMLQDFDTEDELPQEFIEQDVEYEYEQDLQEYLENNVKLEENIDMHDNSIKREDLSKEEEMKKLHGSQHEASDNESIQSVGSTEGEDVSNEESDNEHIQSVVTKREDLSDEESDNENMQSVMTKREDLSDEEEETKKLDSSSQREVSANELGDDSQHEASDNELGDDSQHEASDNELGDDSQHEASDNEDDSIEDLSNDDDEEEEMKRLDAIDEHQLSQFLGFYNTEEALEAAPQVESATSIPLYRYGQTYPDFIPATDNTLNEP